MSLYLEIIMRLNVMLTGPNMLLPALLLSSAMQATTHATCGVYYIKYQREVEEGM